MSARVLIIEDEKALSKILAKRLREKNIEVCVEESGEMAAKKATENNFDLIVLDLLLPGKDGFWVLERIVEKKPNSRVLVISNMSKGGDIAKAESLGILDYITKSDMSIGNVLEKIMGRLKK